jgi:PTH1 family peptidyl-tRNA hydrolase
MTKMIVGLGNPGEKYEHTKHNVGFDVLDILARRQGLKFTREKDFTADVASFFVNGEKILLVKPMTFMNESGKTVGPMMAYYGLLEDDIIVIYDDLDMAAAKLRLRVKGSAGGHNGIKSIIAHIGTQNFKRVKIGIGRPQGKTPVVNHVLSRFDKAIQPEIDVTFENAADAAMEFASGTDFIQTMNRYNA